MRSIKKPNKQRNKKKIAVFWKLVCCYICKYKGDMFQTIVRVRMAPKKDTNGKENRNGKVMMFYERQKNYLKRKRNQKKERLKYLLEKKL